MGNRVVFLCVIPNNYTHLICIVLSENSKMPITAAPPPPPRQAELGGACMSRGASTAHSSHNPRACSIDIEPFAARMTALLATTLPWEVVVMWF